MNLVKIGTFIAELRKDHGLTQEQMGEKIGVTNKTVSRWETGVYLPPADALLAVSELFGVSVNELLTGRRLTDQEYKHIAEENLVQTVRAGSFSLKDKAAYYKKKWRKEHLALMILCGFCVLAVLTAGILLKKGLLVSMAPLLAAFAYAWLHNRMMAYVEQRAYDGLGTDRDPEGS